MKVNVYEQVRDTFIERIEKMIADGTSINWRKPWSIGNGWPINWRTEKRYRGINLFLLPSGEYLTFKQIQELQEIEAYKDIKLKKGSKGFPVFFFKWLDSKEEVDEDGKPEKIPMLKRYTVFSALDVENLPLRHEIQTWEHTAEEREQDLSDALFSYFEREHIRTEETNIGEAYYYPLNDSINVPDKKYFSKFNAFLETLAHESVHSTGHEKRLNRKVQNRFGTEKYSKEELIAEMGAAMLLAEYGIDDSMTQENATAYLYSWLTKVKEGSGKELVCAAAGAQKAVDYILDRKFTEAELKGC